MSESSESPMRLRVETYRSLVRKAAAGEATASDKASALVTARAMKLPESQWRRDVAAFRELARVDSEIRTFNDTEQQRAAQLATLQREIGRAQKLIRDCESAAKMLSTAAHTAYAHCVQRQDDLTAKFPHLFAPIDEAAAALDETLPLPEPTT
jgi:hypothetical protein